jgi:NAD(P)-dependent dehydrogenase (short-subunit alcohol dehydrogenase family)
VTADVPLGGKVILVVGASRGIGGAAACALESEGANVIKADIAISPEAGAQPVSNSIHLDVRSSGSVEAAFARLEHQFGGVDALVNCAGVGVFKPVAELTDEDWNNVLSTNLTGAFLCVRSALRQMLRRGGGRIIHIGSVADHVPLPSNGVYGVSKAGLRMLTQIVNEDYKHDGVRATLISLGAVYTDIWRSRPEFDRADMLDVADVARAIVGILKEPPHVRIDNVVLLPPKGIL